MHIMSKITSSIPGFNPEDFINIRGQYYHIWPMNLFPNGGEEISLRSLSDDERRELRSIIGTSKSRLARMSGATLASTMQREYNLAARHEAFLFSKVDSLYDEGVDFEKFDHYREVMKNRRRALARLARRLAS